MPQAFPSNLKLKKPESSKLPKKHKKQILRRVLPAQDDTGLRVAVLCGGSSSERKISLRSGKAVYAALQRAGFQTTRLDPRNWPKTAASLKKQDVVFVALHGKGGEDGVLQKKLDKLNIPYIGSDARSSWNAFDKALSKKIFLRNSIPTPEGVVVPEAGWKAQFSRLRPPLFVKPAKEGSSIGAFEIEDLRRGAEKIKRSLKRYGTLLVEKKIDGREFTVGILGDQALPVVEMKPKKGFYDYKAKYTKGMTKYQVPARIPDGLAKKMQKTALKVHKALGLRDFSRVDIMTDKQGNHYVLEANSIPGFTELSLLPKAAQAAGISFEELCAKLVGFALKRK